jgi:hypothetical protein
VSVVRPELGPTLPELLGPRFRALPLVARAMLVLIAAAAVAAVGWLLLRPEPGRETIVVREQPAFNLSHDDGLRRLARRPGELLRLGQGGAAGPSFAVAPLRLAPYRGDASAQLTLLSARLIQEMRSTLPAFVWRGDGRTRINDSPGYQILFQLRRDGRTHYGRRVLLVPDEPAPREGADLTLITPRSAAIPTVEAVGANGPLKTPLRSFRFGTQPP